MDNAIALDERVLRRLAGDLLACHSGGPLCRPLRDQVPGGGEAEGYAIQDHLTEHWLAEGRRLVGRKIGLTAPIVQQQFGVHQPDYGMLFADMAVPDGGTVPWGRLRQPKVEGELAFVLGADLDGDIDMERVRAAIDTVHAAIEVPDSRIAGWNIRILDTVADNASSGVFTVAGEGVPLARVDTVNCTMRLTANGQTVSEGRGAACLGDPLTAVLWLARKMAEVGRPLRAGDVVMSGALGPMVAAEPGTRYEVVVDGVNACALAFGEAGAA